MTIIIFLVILLGLFHFLYEGIIAPSLRLRLRFDLFRLRDQVRRLQFENPSETNREVFGYLEHRLNNALLLVSRLNLESIRRAERQMKDNPGLARRAETEFQKIEQSNVPQIRDINQAAIRLLSRAVLINSGGWFIYIIPLVLAVALYGTCRQLIGKAITFPENELRIIAPSDRPLTA